MADNAVLSLREIEYRYGRGSVVLGGVSLDLWSGNRIALLGANGSGKTTLLRVAVALAKPHSGSISLDGQPVGVTRKERTRLRTAVQYVLQEPDDQIFAATVRSDVSFGPVNLELERAEVIARVDAALEALAITDLADRAPHHLSFGQRKRVALAGALAMHPRVLLLDEPTAGLDPQAVDDLLETLTHLANSGTAVVMATHDVDVAWRWAQEVIILQDGTTTRGDTASVLSSEQLLSDAGLSIPWGAEVSRLLGETVLTPADLAGRRLR